MKTAEYLSREFVLSCVDSFLSKTDMPIAAQYFYDCFRECEAEDVQPVKHGRWLPSDACITIDCQVCSECRSNIIMDRFYYDYCPVCGARMDGETNG